jgi:cytosine/adenosine deaminase-related metal-dependent hydrolase
MSRVGDRIAAVGQGLGPAKREIDAYGLLVTPGFFDIHTHYDGQATWDPYLTPSSWHGVVHRGDHCDPARHASCGNFAANDDNRTSRS